MGRAPKPTALKVLAGNPGHRTLNEREPAPSRGVIPRAPRWMGEIAKREWHRVVAVLYHAGLLTTVDRAMLEGYCVHYERWVTATQIVMRMGDVIYTVNGNLVQNPHLSVANRAYELYSVACREFGMSPASRTRVAAAPQEEKSLAELLFDGETVEDIEDANG